MVEFLSPSFIIAMLLALSFHEWAHGYAAYLLGDPTAKYEGRLTLNPLVHLDPIGTLLFFIIGFGWGKPVPVNPRYFRHYRRDTALVALAGPAINLLLACITFLLFWILTLVDTFIIQAGVGRIFLGNVLSYSFMLNLTLMAFNLLPIAPLDGSKIVASFIPVKYEDLYEQYLHYGPYILLFLLLAERFIRFSVFSLWIDAVTRPFYFIVALATQ